MLWRPATSTILLTARTEGRSEKMAPFWTRALWAMDRSVMMMIGDVPIWRVIMGPYLAMKLRIIDSSSRGECRSHKKAVRIENVNGPGGSLLGGPWREGKRNNLTRNKNERETIRRRIHFSIFLLYVETKHTHTHIYTNI